MVASIPMRLLLRATWLFICKTFWYWFGVTPAGRALVKALNSEDENIRSVAGILLAKSGKRAEPLLQEALERRENLPTVLTVLGSIGDPELIPQFQQFTADQNPDVAKAAKEALKVAELSAKA